MKKFIIIFLVLFSFCSCCSSVSEENDGVKVKKESPQNKGKRIKFIESNYMSFLFYDSETGVMYIMNRYGGVSPLIDQEGKVCIYGY